MEKNIPSGIPPEQVAAIKKSIETAAELISQDFENGAVSSLKATAAFVGGMAGGPVGAFAAAAAVSARESNINTQKFVQAVMKTGIPLTVNGQRVNYGDNQSIQETKKLEQRQAQINTTVIGVTGVAVVFLGVSAWLLFSD